MKTIKYREVKRLNLPEIDKEILQFWSDENIFEQSVSQRERQETFVFYEGPPSVNGMPGIHHVMGRTIKDMYCRFHSLKGKKVQRKAGWDTHGLPIELAVEKKLGITKEDIGKTITVEQYNAECRKEAMKYIDVWNDITKQMGYWVDLDNPYVTYNNQYIETLWYLLKQLYDKGLLYKGYTIQPYSPAAGTGLSSHELNQPGCYRDVSDTSATAQFKVIRNQHSELLFANTQLNEVHFLAWTTTPWTLPSNTALAVGAKVQYVQVETWNKYTHQRVCVVLAKDLLSSYLKPEWAELDFDSYDATAKKKILPYRIVGEFMGRELTGIYYEQLLPYAQPEDGDAFRVVIGDFVTTDSGTGMVHIAPSFGADDMRVGRQNGIGSLTLVDKRGKFLEVVKDFANRPVKNYDNLPEKEYRPVDVDIVIKLKQENKCFDAKKYVHSYPHCWRTDKPIVYYPLDSWFVRTTEFKERMVALNKTIQWKPASTGEGRFGNWLENLVDWNLSRSRFWGTPLPIWRTKDGEEEICIGSIAELRSEIDKSVAAGFMAANLDEENFDLHRPYVDDIVLVAPSGKKMYREPDLIDVWFDSGAMPYAQQHYPFENKERIESGSHFPADFIAEGVDQTRGWFFTLHAIGSMLFNSVAFKTVVSNGLVLDANGEKMSKRKGNVINPFEAIGNLGADAVRWYIIANSNPWDNLRFSMKGVQEVQRKFLGTLFNTYSFFALYANIDGFSYQESEVPVSERPEIDRWIISLLNSLVKQTNDLYSDYEATRAARQIQGFVTEHLSNWYVRLCRRRFWKGDYNQDKIAAYQTLYTCLSTVAQLMSPVAPFFADFLYRNLNNTSQKQSVKSVHLTDYPTCSTALVDKDLEERMQKAQDISSMVLSLRKRVDIKVRQPLQRILIPILQASEQAQIEQVKNLILSETNIKEIEYVSDTSGIVKKKIKPDFKMLGRKLGKNMGLVKAMLEGKTDKKGNVVQEGFSQAQIQQFEKEGKYELSINGENITLFLNEVNITSEDIEGWLVNNMNGLTVALDVNISDDLKAEGLAREIVRELQQLRKEQNFNVTDRIALTIVRNKATRQAIEQFSNYICTETLAESLTIVDALEEASTINVNDITLQIDVRVV